MSNRCNVLAFDIAQGVVGTYSSRSGRCGAYRTTANKLRELISLLYAADVIVTFSADTRTPDYDRFQLAEYCKLAKVRLSRRRINATYVDVRWPIWKAFSNHFGHGLRQIYGEQFIDPVGAVRGMSADEHTCAAQTDAVMAYRLWRLLKLS